MEKKLTEAFRTLHMDDHCIKRIEKAMKNETKKHVNTRTLRLALTATCLCLLLPVTALSINKLSQPVKLGEQSIGEEQSFYKVAADVDQWSAENFSESLQADLEMGTIQNIFRNKKSLESYLGFTIADSPSLEEASLVEDLTQAFEYGFALRPQLALDPSARYILTAWDWDGNAVSADPDVLKISSHRVMENSEVYLDAWIVMDSVTRKQLDDGILGENFLPVTGYTMVVAYDEDGNVILNEDGFPTVVTEKFTSSEYQFTSESYTMSNGCIATIITSCFVEPNSDSEYRHKEYMGYFIQGGILYTVRPYAIYDPTLSYPMHDSDMLEVLKVVLDTFE